MPKSNFYTSILIMVFCLVSCTTPYQKLGKRGGYSDEKINDHIYRVTFQGNSRTADDVVYKYFIRRCAELALEHHFNYFIVIETDDKITTKINVAEGSSEKSNKKITTMKYSGETNYAPTQYKTLINHIVEGKIALFKEGEEPLNAYNVEEVLKNVRY
jgi:hypothetical protein